MASSEDDGVAMVIKRAPLTWTPIVDACSNTECIALVTFDWCVYTCDLSDSIRHQKYVKVNFSTSKDDDDNDNDIEIGSVCCGRYHFLALSNDGRVYSWGKNNYGQLGLPKKKQKHRRQQQEKPAPKPRLITDLSDYDVIQVACGDDHSLALTRDGRVFTWGSNGHGQLGIGEEWRTRHHNAKPTEIKGPINNIRHIAAGGAHTVVMSASGSMYVWGRNSYGQLGLRMEQDVKQPMKLKSVQGKVKRISCGENHTSFLFENGELCIYGMGAGTYPCEWCKSELSPARADRSYLYTSLQSIGRHTFVTDECSGRPFFLNHEEIRRQERSQDLQLDALEDTTFVDVFGPDVLSEWPPGCNNIDVKLWKLKKFGVQEYGEETVDRGTGAVGIQNSNQESSRRRIIIIQHEEKTEEHSQSSFSPGRKIPTLTTELLRSLGDVDDPTTEMYRSASLQAARIVFSFPASLGASFSQTGSPEVNGLNIDLKAARQAFESITGKEKLLEWISKVVGTELYRNIQSAPCFDEDLRFYLILFECPIFSYPQFKWSRRVLAAVGRLLISSDISDGNHLSRLARWWKFERVSFCETVTAYRDAVVIFAKNKVLQLRENDDFKTYLQVLKGLNQINLQHDIVSIKTFYIPDLSLVDLREEVVHFMKFGGMLFFAQGFSWLSYPFLIDLQTKAHLLEFHCKIAQEIATESAREIMERQLFQSFLNPFVNPFVPFFPFVPPMHTELIVSREDIFGRRVREQLADMLSLRWSTLQNPLRVTFEGEMGIDEGALSMEFFRLVFDELLDPGKNDLFRYINEQDPNQSKVWFSEECSTTKTAMCGLLLGLSLYNQALVPLPAFPQLLYAKLLGKGPKSEMEELEELDKDYADQMSKLLNGSEEDVIAICYGDELELDNGESVEVTKANVHLYVKKKVRHFLAPSHFAAFQQGFNKLWETDILNFFRPVELESLIIGEECFDWIALEKSTRYIGPYTESHPTIKIFWEVFHALDDDMKRKFLLFVAGSDRVPVGGLQNLGLTIDELPVPNDESFDQGDDHGNDDSRKDRLSRLCPVAQCCDNNQYNRTLRLPMYNSKELIEDRLMITLSFYNCPFHIA